MTRRHDDQGTTPYRTAAVDGVGVVTGKRDRQTLDRPGVDEIMLDLRYEIRGTGPTFRAMPQFLRDRQPPTLAAAGVNDETFPGEVQPRSLTDLPGAEFHPLHTRHFALEDQACEIARLMRDFLGRVLAPGVRP